MDPLFDFDNFDYCETYCGDDNYEDYNYHTNYEPEHIDELVHFEYLDYLKNKCDCDESMLKPFTGTHINSTEKLVKSVKNENKNVQPGVETSGLIKANGLIRNEEVGNWIKKNYEYQLGASVLIEEELYSPFFDKFMVDDKNVAKIELGKLLRQLFKDPEGEKPIENKSVGKKK